MSTMFFGITRVSQRGNHGWWVRLGWSHSRGKTCKPCVHKWFPDRRYGSIGKALDAAIAFRNQHLGDVPTQPKAPLSTHAKANRHLQEQYGKRRVFVGTGEQGSQKAHALGMGGTTCWKVRTGRQNVVTVNNGGWHTSRYDFFGIRQVPTPEELQRVRTLVKSRAPSWMSPDDRTAIENDVLMRMATATRPYVIEYLVSGWCHAHVLEHLPDGRRVALDLNGDIELPSERGKIRGGGDVHSEHLNKERIQGFNAHHPRR